IKKELTKRVDDYKNETLSKTYGDNKKKSEEFIAKKAKEEGVKALPGGTLYKVLTEGNGPKPKASDKVQVIYEGKTIDGNVFDGSEKNNDGKPTEIMLSQVIPGWQEALTNMAEGSEWELYVPFDQAYGNRDMGVIKPFSALIFKIKLVNANSDVTK
ncbi:MAG: FKBP-type peptidyl-prolyl cis-trans isomerase, partial [Bacteroidaceae bacterium]